MQQIGQEGRPPADAKRNPSPDDGRPDQDSEALYHSLVDNLPQNIFRKDREGRFTFGNKNFFQTLKKSPEEVIGKTDFDLFPPALAQKYRQDDLKVIQTGEIFEDVEEHQISNGGKIYVQVVKTPVYDKQNEVIGTQAIFWDVTERRVAEEAARRADLQFRQVWENSADGMRLTDKDGAILMVNDAFCKMVGKEKQDLEGKPLSVIYAEGDQARILTHQRERFLERTIQPRIEREITLWNGERKWFELSNSFLEIEEQPPQLLSVFRDITARKRSQALQAGHNRVLEQLATGKPLPEILEVLINTLDQQMPEALGSVLLLDEDGRRLRHGAAPRLPDEYNRAVDGITIGPHVGSCGTAAYRNECVVVEDIASDPLWANYRQLALGYGLRACWSQPIRSAQGQVLGTFAIYHSQPHRRNDTELALTEGAARLAGIAIERRRAERELEKTLHKLELANAELAEASRTKSEFLANTSHELRTPLTSIIGYLNLVIDGLTDSPEEAMDFVRTARESSKHLLSLINDVLDLAKIEAGKMTIPLEEVNLSECLIQAQTLTQVQANQKNIHLYFKMPDKKIQVCANAGKVKQVLLNLVGNAIKFTHEGSVTVSTRVEGRYGRICVKDTGIGISLETQRRLFQPFVQADGSTTRRFSGTGLGLAITKSLVEKMGGQIILQSEGEGQGVTVEVLLPLSNPAERSVAEDRESAASSRPAGDLVHVLIADDDPAIARFMGRILSKSAYQVCIVNSGAEALERLERKDPVELLILDLMMPGTSGYDVLAVLKDKYGAPPPVVIVTNYADSVSPEQQQLLESAFVKAVIPKVQLYERLPAYLDALFDVDRAGEVA